jgi:hypothetical protein
MEKYMGRQPSKLSAIADYVESQLGHRPAKDTIADVLRELGYVSSSRYWVKA